MREPIEEVECEIIETNETERQLLFKKLIDQMEKLRDGIKESSVGNP